MRNISVKLFGPLIQTMSFKDISMFISGNMCNLVEVHHEAHFCEIRFCCLNNKHNAHALVN